mmetsp:Transcript_174937/g.555409  ORF Transcript_174937/g.555409 Transcript_174937/m.555409 type:complete len:654 (+) Transcript_174937:283-2244(+)
MNLGEMLESPEFRLFDAMSAIEIMDPKMDSGFDSAGDMSLERAEQEGIIKKSLSHSELITMWDELFMYYLLWLDGHTIVQTCWCCLYLQNIKELVRPIPVFGAFIDAFLIACRSAKDAIISANVFDDEDFMPSLFGVDLEACAESTKPDEVSKNLQAQRKMLAGEKSELAKAVASRLEFIGEYALALVELSENKEGKQRNFDQVQRRLKACCGLVEHFGKEEQAADEATLRCFDASFNRSLLVPGPPRIVEPIRDRAQVFGMWTSHLQELQLCCGILRVPLLSLLNGSFAGKSEPNVLGRSVAHICSSDEGHTVKLILDSLDEYLFPKDALEHCREEVDSFLAHCESLLAHLLKLAHATRARKFRRLAHVFLDFNTLQHEAWQLDEKLRETYGCNLRHPRPCWVWTMEHCLDAMISKLFLGFDLNLYDIVEFHMVYWYIDYLYGLRIFNLNELYYNKEQPVGGGDKKKKPTRQQPEKKGVRPKAPPVALLILEATQATVRGLFRLLAFCLCRGLLGVPASATDVLEQRFVLRFRALEHFRLPHLPSFRDFSQSSKSAEAPIVLEAAQASLTEANQVLDKLISGKDLPDNAKVLDSKLLESAKGLKRVVVANQLAVMQLMRAAEANDFDKMEGKVHAATTHHPHLVSLQVRKAN